MQRGVLRRAPSLHSRRIESATTEARSYLRLRSGDSTPVQSNGRGVDDPQAAIAERAQDARITADPVVTNDIVTRFHFLTGRSRTPSFAKLLIAPMYMRSGFVRLVERDIENQAASLPARIVCKMNQLKDPECARCFRVPGSRPDREHPDPFDRRSLPRAFEIYHFAAGSNDSLEGDFLIGSGD
jgi:hypothetical protein